MSDNSMPSRHEARVYVGGGNVFEDLHFGVEEAANLKVRADLMLDLRRYIEARGWTQQEAAERLGETQPRISNLMSGQIDRFSIDKLINLLTQAGLKVRIEVLAE
ncbi:MAG: helix-turn-helix transcriptional regulator [Bacteroidota bacterium]